MRKFRLSENFCRPAESLNELREPGGLGVHLVRRLAARADYRRVDGRNRVEVELAP